MSSKKKLATRIAPQGAKRKPVAKTPTGMLAFMISMLGHPDVQAATGIVYPKFEW